MKAVAYQTAGDLKRPESLVDVTLDQPVASGHDLLVAVAAVSVNPVDTKVRAGASAAPGDWKVLGWDAVGRVVAVGDAVQNFKPGDEVYYAGSITRPGSNSQYHLVDERIAAHKPKSLSNAEAAALPLTSLTAWEMLFDRLDVRKPVAGGANAILIIGGAGGVASMAIQLVRALTDLTVIATASRPETREWVKTLGAHHVLDHTKPLPEQVAALGLGAPSFIFCTTHAKDYVRASAELLAPQGRFGLIEEYEGMDFLPFMQKAASIHWELMFTRAMFQTADMAEQGKLLAEVAKLTDAGKIRTTLTTVLKPINAENLKQAHALLESGKTVGKVVLEGF